MKRLVDLHRSLDATTRTGERLAAIRRYLDAAPPADAAWALWLLAGGRFKRAFAGPRLKDWTAEASGHPRWLVEECHEAAGDLAETIALLHPGAEAQAGAEAGAGDEVAAFDQPLAAFIEAWVAPLPGLEVSARRERFLEAWRSLPTDVLHLWVKMLTGALRVGVQRTLLTRAVAEHAGVDRAVIAHRMMGGLEPTAAGLERLLAAEAGDADALIPYPFMLAAALESPPEDLGPVADWILEWKWDGIRAQLVRRDEVSMVWSRGEEPLDRAFPEIAAVARALPAGTVLDGEIVAWEHERPLPFGMLQQRLGRTDAAPMLFPEVPVRFLAFDLLEAGGVDRRPRPLYERRAELQRIVEAMADEHLRESPSLAEADWSAAARRRATGREVGTEGLMLKHRESPYRVGRVRGDWWKWKLDPYTVDAVLVAAQPGHGRRAGLLTDYTFAVWDGEDLVPIAQAYSGLTDAEIRAVDRQLRSSIVARRGPWRQVEPRLVFEIAFEGIQASRRHRSGVALRFPRMHRWRTDKSPAEADRLETLTAMLARPSGDRSGDHPGDRPGGSLAP